MRQKAQRPTSIDATFEAHPLFPATSPEENPPPVEFIHVTRYCADGPPKWCARRFAADELTDLSQIATWFGGGTYELVARAGTHITARQRYRLDGRPLPLNPEQPVDDAAGAGEIPMAAPASGGSDGRMIELLIGVMQQNAQQMTALVTAMLQMSQASQQTHIQTMAQLYERGAARDAEIFKVIADRGKPEGEKGAVDALLKGLELGREMTIPEDAEESTLGEITNLTQSLVAGASLLHNPPAPTGAPPPPAGPS